MLLFSRDETLEDTHVQDDLDIALEVAKAVGDKRFVIPLRLKAGRKVKGLGDAIPVDFVRGWGEGLSSLLEALQRQKVPRLQAAAEINPNWEVFRRRGCPILSWHQLRKHVRHRTASEYCFFHRAGNNLLEHCRRTAPQALVCFFDCRVLQQQPIEITRTNYVGSVLE